MNNLSNAYSYNDLASLNSITKMGKTDETQALKEVARQFESMFIAMMLKSMRDANSVFAEDNPLNSNEAKFYQQMFDDQLALSMSQGKGVGLADTIYRQMKDQFVAKEGESNKAEAEQENPFMQLKNKSSYRVDNLHKTPEPIQLNSSPLENNTQDIDNASSLKMIETTATLKDTKVDSVIKHTPENDEIKSKLNVTTSKQKGFSTPQEFVNTLWPIAQDVGKSMGVEPKAILAQAALETGWGKYIIHQSSGENSHNLFGIKADRRWSGDVTKVSTLEYRQGLAKKEVAPFRVYPSYKDSLNDYADFVKNSGRYQDAVKQGKSIEGYSEGLQKGGYATDPNYAKKIQRIATGDVLNLAIERAKRG